MFDDYTDITERIPEPPQWWDERGVPRYAEFHPYRAANIYAREVALLEIACFECSNHFQVAVSTAGVGGRPNLCDLAESIEKRDIDYGDPLNYGNCRSGPSTGCLNLRVLQYWSRVNETHRWVRDSSLEIDLPDLENVDKPR